MQPIETMRNCLAGKPMKQIPVSFWRHFPLNDSRPDQFVEATLQWQREFNFDFVKVMPPSSFCLKDWGSRDTYKGSRLGINEYTHFPVSSPDDWLKLKVLDPDSGFLNMQMKALKRIVCAFKNAVPVVHSVFNPVSQMINLCPATVLFDHLINHPSAVAEGLKIITESTINLIGKMAEIELDGIFYIVKNPLFEQQAQFDAHQKLWQKCDLLCLAPATNLWMNILHLHTPLPSLAEYADFPVQIINAHGLHRKDYLQKVKTETNKILCGGLQRFETMTAGSLDMVLNEANDFTENMLPENYILSAECGLPINTPKKNILAAIDFARGRKRC